MTDFRLGSVHEAVQLAKDWKEEGRYDWFRGQTSPWPLRTTRARVPQDRFEEVREKIIRLYQWLCATDGLEKLAADPNAMYAVAQHYGLPTHYLDFTTDPEVAGFFASHGDDLEAGQESCIICIDSHDLVSTMTEVVEITHGTSDRNLLPEAVRLSVPNLWRLEAQSGVFLYLPIVGVENWYPPDRILFPYSGPVSRPTIKEIYPERKSPLEILLDYYFTNERYLVGEREFLELAKRIKQEVKVFQSPPEYRPEYFRDGFLPVLPSWDEDLLESWLIHLHEPWRDAFTAERWDIVIEDAEPGSVSRVETDVASRLASTPRSRSRLIEWSFQFVGEQPAQEWQQRLNRAIHTLWDGMRGLPYTDAQFARAVRSTVELHLHWRKSGVTMLWGHWEGIFSSCMRDPFEIEFGPFDGSNTRALVSGPKLRAAVRPDLADFLIPEQRDQILENLSILLQVVTAPRFLFDFPALADLFAEEIVPAQVTLHDKGPIYFSPARIRILGLP